MNLQQFKTMEPNLLLSIINMKLRNDFRDLDDLGRYYDIDIEQLCQKLADIGYRYQIQTRQFIKL